MDGLDLSAVDQIDQEIFNRSPDQSEDGEDLPLPDCIGIDSAVQDDEESRLRSRESRPGSSGNSRVEVERRMELQALRPDSIRRQLFERSLNDGNDHTGTSTDNGATSSATPGPAFANPRSHVMNITEKAGMSGIDKNRINQIIHEASKGSLFYKRQALRQEEILKSINKMLRRVESATPQQLQNAKMTCDRILDELEKQRVFNRIIVHFDLDMFFAAVEIRDNPELKDQPVAVGGDSMVSTSNYIARRYGVRAAMPGFIAKKLCPELVLIKPNGFKYRKASSEVFSILELYDPELAGMSLDEAYLDLTEHVKNTLERDNLDLQENYDGTLPKVWWTRASEVVEEIRQAIFDKTQLTCSAGISCNTLLAKISTDMNKPNGQFMVEGYPKEVLDFISKTPVEKVSGIGKVSSQFLNALDIKTCGDMYEKRHILPLNFYEINVRFYLRVAIGDGATSVKSDEQRKSKSVERTFSAVKDTLILLEKLDSICEELCSKYLRPYRIRGRTITVKLKRNTFTTTTKSYSMLVATNDKSVIYSAAKNLLLSEISNEPPEISYRLLGVKVSNLADDGVNTNQLTIDAMLRNQALSKPTKSSTNVHRIEEGSSEDKQSMVQSELRDELVTQENPMGAISESGTSESPEILSDNDSEPIDGVAQSKPQKKARLSNTKIESFFQKRATEPGDEARSQSEPDQGLDTSAFFTQEDDEQFFDAGSRSDLDTYPNATSQSERNQGRPFDEDDRCPYCLKPFNDVNLLISHAENCSLKIPIDVNRSFISQRPQTTELAKNFFASQAASARGTRPKSASGTGRKARTPRRTSKSAASPTIPSQLPTSSSIPVGSPRGRASKSSFFEKFIDSNRSCLSQSSKADPFQCPHCFHGFLDFASLEAHVIMCTKQK